jgi:hypothetical protein
MSTSDFAASGAPAASSRRILALAASLDPERRFLDAGLRGEIAPLSILLSSRILSAATASNPRIESHWR